MNRRSFIAGLFSIPFGILAKKLFRKKPVGSQVSYSVSYRDLGVESNVSFNEIPLPTGQTVYLYKADLRKLLEANPYPLTIADGEAYQRDLVKHRCRWRYGNV